MRRNRKNLILEILLILFVSLFLAIIYNTVSPRGIEILPKKKETSALLSLRAERSNLTIEKEGML